MAPSVSVVLPVLNESGLPALVNAIRAQVPAAEIVVVDDGNAEPLPDVRWIRGARRGKGHAVRDGLRAATGDVVLVMDADLAALLPRLPEFVTLLEQGNDVVIAERKPDWHTRTPLRFVLSYGLYLLQRYFVLGTRRFTDTQCGFKAFRRDAAAHLAARQRVDGGMYDIEYLYIALKAGLRVATVPVGVLAETRPSKLRLWRCLRQDPLDLVRIKGRGLVGRYR